jgi:hypothetical protein
MGACCCKPRWKSDDESVICAYIYEECACFRAKTFVFRGDEDGAWANAAKAKEMVEADIFNPAGLPVSIARDGYPHFDTAVSKMNSEWAAKMNKKIETYGFEVDGFEWTEYRYVSHGKGGGHTQPVAHFCIRVRKLAGGGETIRIDEEGKEK